MVAAAADRDGEQPTLGDGAYALGDGPRTVEQISWSGVAKPTGLGYVLDPLQAAVAQW